MQGVEEGGGGGGRRWRREGVELLCPVYAQSSLDPPPPRVLYLDALRPPSAEWKRY